MSDRERIGIRVLDTIDWLLNGALRIVLFVVLGICIFSLYDTYKIYNDAAPDNMYSRYRPLADGSSGLSFGELKEQNPDVVAWLTLDDTNIDYPVVKGSDNSYYLNRDALGEYSLSGSIFMDFENSPDFSDPYTLLYGHHMDYNVMFGGLDFFEDEEYFNAHRTGKLWVDDEHYYELAVIACMSTDAYDRYVFRVTPDGNEDDMLSSLYDYLQKEALIYMKDADTKSRLLGLSTCTGAGTNARTLVFCTIGESVLKQLTTD